MKDETVYGWTMASELHGPDMRTPARFAGEDGPMAEAFKAAQAKVVQILVGVARGDQMREQDAIAARQVLRAMGLEV
jgi:hypothetical protein